MPEPASRGQRQHDGGAATHPHTRGRAKQATSRTQRVYGSECVPASAVPTPVYGGEMAGSGDRSIVRAPAADAAAIDSDRPYRGYGSRRQQPGGLRPSGTRQHRTTDVARKRNAQHPDARPQTASQRAHLTGRSRSDDCGRGVPSTPPNESSGCVQRRD